jgi:uncharacterized protein YgiM (DUF1202 family)
VVFSVTRQTGFALACCLLGAGRALGAAGDVLMVTGDNVNVRGGPGLAHAVSRQLDRDQRVIEIGRHGEWVYAEMPGAGGAKGWIHGSLLEPAPSLAEPPAASPPPAAAAPLPAERAAGTGAAPPPEAPPEILAEPDAIAPAAAPEVDPALQRFRDSVDYLNSRSQAVAGAELFGAVEPLGGGAVQVVATAAWSTITPPGQRSYASTLLDRWAAASGGAPGVRVQIVDAAGQVLMEQRKP